MLTIGDRLTRINVSDGSRASGGPSGTQAHPYLLNLAAGYHWFYFVMDGPAGAGVCRFYEAKVIGV